MKHIVALTLIMFLLSGCMPNSQSENTTPSTSPATVTPSEINTENTEREMAATEATETDAPLRAIIYRGNDHADGFESEYVTVEHLDTATLIQELIKANVLADGTEVLSENLIGTCLHLDFNSEFQTLLCSMGTSGEYMITGSLVNTFLDNFMDTVQSVYVTVNGEILESGHVIYDFEMTRYN